MAEQKKQETNGWWVKFAIWLMVVDSASSLLLGNDVLFNIMILVVFVAAYGPVMKDDMILSNFWSWFSFIIILVNLNSIFDRISIF